MAKLTGLAYINVNGSRQRSKPGATLKVGGAIRKAETDVSGFAGHRTEEIKPGEVVFTLVHASDTDLIALQQIDGATVLFETDSGQRYLVANASTEGEVTLKGGEVELTLTGNPAEAM